MKTRPDLSFWKLWNLSFGFFGVQIAYALQSGNISRIFRTLGADPHSLSFFWILPPLMGIIVQPIVGTLSDKTWCRFGRRIPYLFVGAAMAVAVMCLLPNAGSFGMGVSAALIFGLIALMLLDTSINMAMQPFKMLVGDMVNEKQKAKAYSIQSFLCNAGSVVGFVFPFFFTWIGLNNVAPEGVVPDTVIWSFYIGAIILILCVIYTTVKVKEWNPSEYVAYNGEKSAENFEYRKELTDWHKIIAYVIYAFFFIGLWPIFLFINMIALLFEKNSCDSLWWRILCGKVFGIFGWTYAMLKNAPATFWRVGLVQFFCWAALLYMWTYVVDAVSETVWGTTESATAEYQEAGNWTGILYAIQALASVVWAAVLPRFSNMKVAYAVSLLIGGLGFALIPFVHDKYLMVIPFILIGAAWAAMLAMPFTFVTNALEGYGHMGAYLGLFNGTICVPQIVAALCGGFVFQLVGAHQSTMMIVSGVLLALGAISVSAIKTRA